MLLGFDIGGTKCAVVLGAKHHGQIKLIDKVVLNTVGPAQEMISSLFSATETLLDKNGVPIHEVTGIGISCGGPLNSKAGFILSPPNLPGWDNVPITALAIQRFGIKAYLQNDANACACAEWKYGAGRGYRNIVFLTFGTGMGAGLILNGQLYSGANDLAGEAGHIRLADAGPMGYGKGGSFEGFCSGGGIARMAQMSAKEQLQKGKLVSFCESMANLPFITAKTVADAAYKGDAIAIEIYKNCAQHLGKGLAVLMDILNPEVVIIGSIYCKAQSLIEPHMRAVLEQEVLPGAYSSCSIVPASLGENIGDYAALAMADV